MAAASSHACGIEAAARSVWHKSRSQISKCQMRCQRIHAHLHQSRRVQRNNRLPASRQLTVHASLSDVSALEAEEGWKGAVVYRRDARQFEFSFVTTLERLALPHLSSPQARELSLDLVGEGIVKEDEHRASDDDSERRGGEEKQRGLKSHDDGGTLVTVDLCVRREGRDLHLEGEAETVFALQCHRCLQATAEPVHATFSLLLTTAPVHEPTQRHLGVVLGREKHLNYAWGDALANEEAGPAPGEPSAELDLDLDDKIFFPLDQSEIDISKHIRDAIHLEVPLKVMCSAGSGCKGVCLDCGVNLNASNCTCGSTSDSRPTSLKATVTGAGGGPTNTSGSGASNKKKKGAMSLKEQLEALYSKDQ